jgi:hypothetical protein
MSAKRPARNGSVASKSTGSVSRAKPARASNIQTLLAAIYNDYQRLDERKLNARCRRNFVFHMTDWSENLRELAELYQHPEKFSRQEAGRIVSGFLFHVIPHLRAAGRLMLDYAPEDFFKELDRTDG